VDSVSLAVNRATPISQWKGLASADTACRAVHNSMLAKRGITGPSGVFEGHGGFMETVRKRFEVDWEKEDLELVRKTIVKKFNAEVHSQSALEAMVELRTAHQIDASQVEAVTIDIFRIAYDIIGGGKFGAKTEVRTKEDADHSLPYMAAVALLDGQVMPEQYDGERIRRDDVQTLLRKVTVRPKFIYTWKYPDEMWCRVRVSIKGGKQFQLEKCDCEGFWKRPMSWDRVVQKFERFCGRFADAHLRKQIISAVENLENIQIRDLTRLLGEAGDREHPGHRNAENPPHDQVMPGERRRTDAEHELRKTPQSTTGRIRD
jgi:2-methylcitrate dehydratase